MHLPQMHAQLQELGNEYERLAQLPAKLRSISEQVASSIAHLSSLKYNIDSQIEVFSQLAPVNTDTE